MIRSRRLRLGLLMAGAALAAAAAAVAAICALAEPALRQRWDWTRAGRATLSARTASALAALPEGSRATAFLLVRSEDPRLLVNGSAVVPRAHARLRSLLEDARLRARGRLQIRILEDTSSLALLERETSRLEREPGETLILEAGQRRQVLRFGDLFVTTEPDLASGAPAQIRQDRVDDALGDAALRLGRENLPRAAIVQGFLDPSSPAPRFLEPLADLIRAEGYEPVLVRGAKDADGDLLVVPGQTVPFPPDDAEAAREWIAAGRPLLLALGAAAPGSVVSFWNELLAGRGLRAGDGLVCEPWRNETGLDRCADLVVPPERLSPSHPATRDLAAAGRSAVFPASRPLEILPGNNEFAREPLARTGPRSWVDVGDDFVPGSREPLQECLVAAAAERWNPAEQGPARTLLLGSGQALHEGNLPYNRDFVARSLAWLLQEEDRTPGLVSLESLPFRPSPRDLARIHNLGILALPGATLLLGLLVYLRRR